MRTGQEVIVTDPKMKIYLPVASSTPEPEGHTIPEVLLRFSSVIGGKKEAILHAIGATATFGRDLSKAPFASPDGWTIGGGSIPLLRPPKGQSTGCKPIGLPKAKTDGPFVLLIDRGDCTFVQKMIYAQQAGATGVIVVDLPPEVLEEYGETTGGTLIRPSFDSALDAEIEALDHARKVTKGPETGMIFVISAVGDLLKKAMGVNKIELVVDVMSLDGVVVEEKEEVPVGDGAVREGRLALGDWEIYNLMIVDGDGQR